MLGGFLSEIFCVWHNFKGLLLFRFFFQLSSFFLKSLTDFFLTFQLKFYYWLVEVSSLSLAFSLSSSWWWTSCSSVSPWMIPWSAFILSAYHFCSAACFSIQAHAVWCSTAFISVSSFIGSSVTFFYWAALCCFTSWMLPLKPQLGWLEPHILSYKPLLLGPLARV